MCWFVNIWFIIGRGYCMDKSEQMLVVTKIKSTNRKNCYCTCIYIYVYGLNGVDIHIMYIDKVHGDLYVGWNYLFVR